MAKTTNQAQNQQGEICFLDELNYEKTIVVRDAWIAALLVTCGLQCKMLTVRAGQPYAVFDDTPKFDRILRRIETGSLKVDAYQFWYSFTQLEAALADEHYAQSGGA